MDQRRNEKKTETAIKSEKPAAGTRGKVRKNADERFISGAKILVFLFFPKRNENESKTDKQ